MLTFKTFLSESGPIIPHVYCSIGRSKDQELTEWYWENAKPGENRDTYDFQENDRDDIAASIREYKKGVEDNHLDLMDAFSPLIDHVASRPDLHTAMKNYILDSKPINLPLVRLHETGTRIDDPSHVRAAFEHLHRTNRLTGSGIDTTNRDAFAERQRLIHEAINHPANRGTHGGFFVYSGVGGDFHINKLKTQNQGLLHLPAFTSTSLDPSTARTFATDYGRNDEGVFVRKKPIPEMMRIWIPHNFKKGIYMDTKRRDFGGIGEKEFILDKGTNLRVKGEPRVFRDRFHIFSEDQRHVLIHDAEIV